MDIFNDFDLYQEALKKVDLTEAAMPIVRGIIVEDVDTYNKIQKLLNTPALEPCHKFLYNLDVEQLSEDEVSKVNNLYKLGQERGFIESDDEEQTDEGEEEKNVEECGIAPTPTSAPIPPTPLPVDNVAFTVAYSAMKDGMMKTGEAYSNAVSTRAAKADVISKLEKAGYSSIEILCIEAGDPDVRGCDNTYCAQPIQPVVPTTPISSDVNQLPIESEDDQVEEADDKKDDEAADDKADDSAGDSDDKADDSKDDAGDDEEAKSDDKEEKSDDGDETEEKKEDAEEPDEKLDDKSDEKAADATDDKDEDELKPDQKAALKDSYKKAFKAAMQKCKFETSFSELSLEDKVKFFTELSKAWGNKADPSKFMTDKEVDQLEKIVVKKN